MLDSFLDTVYRHETEKTASAALEAKLRTMPSALVEKIAMLGSTPKCVGDSDDVKCWLDNFKGTPLFEKAVELERAEIQLEQADIEQRMQQQAQNTWTQRDALRLQKKMLELDLAMAGAGAEVSPEVSAEVAPEAAEEAAIGTLEQVQAEEAAAGEGNKPEEKMENAAIEQLHAAHGEGSQPPPAQEKAPEQPAQVAPSGPPGAGAPPPPPPKKEPPKPPAKKEPKEGEPSEGEKQASLKVAAAAAAGRLLAKTAEPAPPKGMSAKEWDKELQKKASTKVALEVPLGTLVGGLAGANKAHEAGQAPSAGALRGAAGVEGGSFLGGAAGHGIGSALAKKLKMDHTTGGNVGRLLGTVAGGAGGYHAMTHSLKKKEASVLSQSAREHIKPSNFAEPKADGPGDTGKYPIEDKKHARAALGLVGMHGSAAEKAKVHAAVAKKYPGLGGSDKTAGIVGGLVGAAKAAVPQVAGVAKAGGNMLGTAMKAGGLPQVAKSVGNVASGFAKANPLAAAGAAGAAGIAAGRLSKGNSQPRMQG